MLLVSAQSHLHDRNDGGIWRSEDRGKSFARTSTAPTFTLTVLKDGSILATHARQPQRSVSVSMDAGKTWTDSGALGWKDHAVPFYTCAAQMSDGETLVVAGMTAQDTNASATDSAFFVRRGTSKEVLTITLTTTNRRHNVILVCGSPLCPPGSGALFANPPPWMRTACQRINSPHRPRSIICIPPETAPSCCLPSPTPLQPKHGGIRSSSLHLFKDRMALLADPDIPDLLYVAGVQQHYYHHCHTAKPS